MKNMNPEKKVKRIIYIVMILLAIVVFIPTLYIRVNYSIPSIILYACMLFVYIMGINLFGKWLTKSKWKDTFYEMEKKVEKKKRKEKPSIFSIAVFALSFSAYSIFKGVKIVNDILTNYSKGLEFKDVLPDCINIATLMICSIFIGIIAYNIKKNKVFVHANAKLIYGVGLTLLTSIMIQKHYWDATSMIPNEDVSNYYYLLIFFILFFGNLFDIAIRIKEEQDLTI